MFRDILSLHLYEEKKKKPPFKNILMDANNIKIILEENDYRSIGYGVTLTEYRVFRVIETMEEIKQKLIMRPKS